MIIFLIIWSVVGFCIGVAWITEDVIEDAEPLRKTVAILICGPIFWILLFGAFIHNKVGVWIQGE